jgi:hypothetical protein
MWITKPIVAFVSGIVFVISVLVTALGTAILLAVDIPSVLGLSPAEVNTIIVISVFVLFLSAGIYTFQRYSVIQDLRIRLDERRDLQKKVDKLAKLRSRAVNRIYAGTPDPDRFDSWKAEYKAWHDEVKDFLEENFPFAVVEMFADLGAIIPYDFTHASNDPIIGSKHKKSLQMLAKELTIIERLIRENTTLTLEAQPSFMELIKWENHL